MQVFAETEDVVDDVAEAIENLDSSLFVMTFQDMSMGGFGESIALTQEEQVATIQDQASQQIAIIQDQASQQIAALQDDVSNIESLGVQISLVAGIAGVLMIFGLMFYTVRERTKEIGALKALGFSKWDVMKQFMYEGLYIGLIGGAIGLGIAAVSASVFSTWLLNLSDTLDTSVSMTVTMEAMLLGLAMAAIAGALGSLYPAWRASRVSPMEALRNE